MKNSQQLNPQEAKIQGLLGRYLTLRSSSKDALGAGETHLDEDSLAAFVEGNLAKREAMPIVTHLVDCSFCRHVTAELVRLDMAFAETPAAVKFAGDAEPSKVSEVLNGLISRIFGTRDGAVFAHNEKDEDKEDPKEPESKEDK